MTAQRESGSQFTITPAGIDALAADDAIQAKLNAEALDLIAHLLRDPARASACWRTSRNWCAAPGAA
jgi:hypothetical protein